jgi:hypothetical protein
MYRSCPHKWSLQYKDGHYDDSPSIHFTFGTAMHEVIQDWLTVLYEESATKADQINLEEQFQEKFIGLYKESYSKNDETHYSSPEELREFFEDGVAILDFIKKKRNQYFSKRGTLKPNQTKTSKCSLYFIRNFLMNSMEFHLKILK